MSKKDLLRKKLQELNVPEDEIAEALELLTPKKRTTRLYKLYVDPNSEAYNQISSIVEQHSLRFELHRKSKAPQIEELSIIQGDYNA